MDENHHFIRSLSSNMTKYKLLFDSKKKKINSHLKVLKCTVSCKKLDSRSKSSILYSVLDLRGIQCRGASIGETCSPFLFPVSFALFFRKS